MAKDRHRPGYYEEYNKKHPGKKDRHRPGYYHKYNQEHPERLERGFTKGYKNGNVSEGPSNGKGRRRQGNSRVQGKRTWYDRMFHPTLSELLYDKVHVEWHDDDWCEDDD